MYQTDQPKVLAIAVSWFLHLTEVPLYTESLPSSPHRSPVHLEEVSHPYGDCLLRAAVK